ncbi:hypothetical protein BH09MYX1_BH09MYX1_02840 [soil metagenome]
MRVRISPASVEPGGTFVASVELESKSETPVDEVRISFSYYELSYGAAIGPSYTQEALWKPGTLAIGKLAKEVRFQTPTVGSPTYRGPNASVSYLVTVHVAIPWWRDREASFSIPVVTAPIVPPDRPSPLHATSDGPRAGELYIELSADRDHIAPGETLVGTVSFANVSTRRVRGVEAAFVKTESTRVPSSYPELRWAAQIHRGAPPEQTSIPFRISIPADASPSFRAQTFSVDWRFEIRAQTAMGADVVLGFPLRVIRRPPDASAPVSRRPLLVGRDRWGAVWASLAQRFAMTFDPEQQSLTAARGPVSLDLRREVAGTHVAVVARIRYARLGIGIQLRERTFTDFLGPSGKVHLPNALADKRFFANAREPRQAAPLLTEDLLESLLVFTEVRMDDYELQFSVARAATTTQSLTPVIAAAVKTLESMSSAIELIPPPLSMTSSLPAWHAFAESVGGRLERGRMWIHDGELGGERFEIGTMWDGSSSIDTLVRVHAAPPFDTDFSVDDPALSAKVRDDLRHLMKLPAFSGLRDAVSFVLPGGVNDPETLRTDLERAAALVHGRRGLRASGPFR